jgi:hypothetical protein
MMHMKTVYSTLFLVLFLVPSVHAQNQGDADRGASPDCHRKSGGGDTPMNAPEIGMGGLGSSMLLLVSGVLMGRDRRHCG